MERRGIKGEGSSFHKVFLSIKNFVVNLFFVGLPDLTLKIIKEFYFA